MSAQRLSAKTVRRIERNTGLEVKRAWAHGGYDHAFVTPDHRHGYVNIKNWQVGWEDPESPFSFHYTSCREMFPDDF